MLGPPYYLPYLRPNQILAARGAARMSRPPGGAFYRRPCFMQTPILGINRFLGEILARLE